MSKPVTVREVNRGGRIDTIYTCYYSLFIPSNFNHGDDMDKKEIIEVFKTEGIEVAEEMAVAAVKSAFRLIAILVPKWSKAAGLMIVPVLVYIEPFVLRMVDRIDGKDNPKY